MLCGTGEDSTPENWNNYKMAERGSKMLKSVIHLITKMSVDRSDEEIEAFIPWLCKISALFASLKKGE